MEKENVNMFVISIIAIVAIVGIVSLFSGQKTCMVQKSSINDISENLGGLAHKNIKISNYPDTYEKYAINEINSKIREWNNIYSLSEEGYCFYRKSTDGKLVESEVIIIPLSKNKCEDFTQLITTDNCDIDGHINEDGSGYFDHFKNGNWSRTIWEEPLY